MLEAWADLRAKVTLPVLGFCLVLLMGFVALVAIFSKVFGIAAGAGIMGATAALAFISARSESELEEELEADTQDAPPRGGSGSAASNSRGGSKQLLPENFQVNSTHGSILAPRESAWKPGSPHRACGKLDFCLPSRGNFELLEPWEDLNEQCTAKAPGSLKACGSRGSRYDGRYTYGDEGPCRSKIGCKCRETRQSGNANSGFTMVAQCAQRSFKVWRKCCDDAASACCEGIDCEVNCKSTSWW
eukprot:g27704.t1